MINFSTKHFPVKLILTTLSFIFSVSFCCYAQTDTIVINNEKIACSVKEITPDAVKYTFPGEDLLNSVYKNTVQKIIFKSGRVQTFAEATSYKAIAGVTDYNNVSITTIESEVKGLYKLGDVSSKAKGTTKLSNEEKVKERAYHKLKIEAAMLGANIVFLTNQQSTGSRVGYLGSKAATNLTGVGYSNILPDYNKFKTTFGSKSNLWAVHQFKMYSSDSDLSQNDIHKSFTIHNVTNDNGIVHIEADLQGEHITKFQLVSFSDNSFSVAYQDGDTDYNIVIKF